MLERVLTIATKPGDLVLDSFAGSGTTGAVAHKMGRRWIMAELGEHAQTHIVPRMRKVIDGQDPGGITEATGWQGGGGFRYFRLAPSLLKRDHYGQWVIAAEYRPEMLAEAVCKLMGFTYAPSQDAATYWRHGHSTETDFIFVTTQAMTYEALAKLSEEVGDGYTLLVACRAYSAKDDAFPNLTPKKIPLAVLAKCEWGRDDYSLQVRAEVESGDGEDEDEPTAVLPVRRGRPRKAAPATGEAPTLFEGET
ncbi:Modification methylase BamHI [Methylobacterium brachiatum]|nr:Modification methylase BamHI [Methylobacterium brachiatum]